MEQFEYTIKDPNGLHARPAGLLIRRMQTVEGEWTIEKEGRSANLKKLLAVMGLGVRCGDRITVRAEGDYRAEDVLEIKRFFEEHF